VISGTRNASKKRQEEEKYGKAEKPAPFSEVLGRNQPESKRAEDGSSGKENVNRKRKKEGLAG